MRFAALFLFLALALPAHAEDRCWPNNAGGTYPLNSVTFSPSSSGIDVRGYDKYLTIDYEKISGTQAINVEVYLENGWKTLLPTLSDDFYGAINPDNVVIHRVRINMSTCTACSATARICSRPNN